MWSTRPVGLIEGRWMDKRGKGKSCIACIWEMAGCTRGLVGLHWMDGLDR